MATMKYYQLYDGSWSYGIVATNASQDTVKGMWKRINEEDYTEDEEDALNGIGIVGGSIWNAERINVIDVNV